MAYVFKKEEKRSKTYKNVKDSLVKFQETDNLVNVKGFKASRVASNHAPALKSNTSVCKDAIAADVKMQTLQCCLFSIHS